MARRQALPLTPIRHAAPLLKINKDAGVKGGHREAMGSALIAEAYAAPPLNHKVLRKLRALWLSAYWLDVVENRSDEAMRAFVKRQIGIDHEHWMTPQSAYKAIEALKAMLEREGVHFIPGHNPRYRVVLAQWKKLFWQQKIHAPGHAGLEAWCHVVGLGYNPHMYTDDVLDALIVRLGKWIRKNGK